MKTRILPGAIAVTFLAMTGLLAQPGKSTPLQEFMRQKLEYSKGVLEGRATEDFDFETHPFLSEMKPEHRRIIRCGASLRY